MRISMSPGLLVILAAGCARGPQAGTHAYGWEVVKQGSCQGISFAQAEGRGAGMPMAMSGSGGPPSPPAPTLVFRLTMPNQPAGSNMGSAHAFLLREDGSEIPIGLKGDSEDPKTVDVEFLAEHAKSQSTADVKVVLAGGDTSVFRLHLPPRDLPDLPPGGTTSVAHNGITISGDAWCEPPRNQGDLPLTAGVLTVKGLRTSDMAWSIASPAVYLPDREPEPKPFRDRMLYGVSPSGDWSMGQRWSGPWTSDPKIVRMTGTLASWKTFSETVDLGTVPLKIQRIIGDNSKNPFTLAVDKIKAKTPSGFTVTLTPGKAGTIDFVEVREGYSKIVLHLLAEQSLITGIPHQLRGTGSPVLEVRNLAPEAHDTYHPVRFDLEGQAVVYVEAKSPGPSLAVHLKLEFRRRMMVDQTPFDLRIPVRRNVRTVLSEHQQANPTGAILTSMFDPATITESPAKRIAKAR